MPTVKMMDSYGFKFIRIMCACFYSGHSLDISVDKDLSDHRFYVGLSLLESTSLLTRIKNAFNVLFIGKSTALGEVVLTNADVREIANFLISNLPDSRIDIP